MREEQTDVGQLVKFLFRGLLLALPLAALVAAGVYLFSQRLGPTFEASAIILATKSTNTFSPNSASLSAPPLEAAAYSDIARTRPVLGDATSRLGVRNLNVADFADTVVVTVQGERDALSNLIDVQVEAGTARIAARRANAVAQALVDWDYRRASQNIGRGIETLEAQIASLDNSIESLRLMGEVASQSEIDNRIALRSQQQEELSYARALLASAAGLLSVVEPATPPRAPVAPRPVFYAALAAIFTVFVVYGVMLLRSALDTRLRDVEAVKQAADLPVLAEFPDTRNAHLLREAADYFQARLLLASSTPGKRVILLSSPKSDEGKTTVALHLAESLTRHGYKTLLVDADLRQPTIAKRYNIPRNDNSLLDYLADPDKHHPTQLLVSGSDLDVVPGFRPAATPLLARNLPACLELWKRDYDVIVFDSAPLLAVADTFSIAPLCTHTVLVSNLKRSDRRSLSAAAERLKVMGIPLVGVVVTRAKQRLDSREYRRYIRAATE